MTQATRRKHPLVLAAILAATVSVGLWAARGAAADPVTAAIVGGVDSSAGAVPELVLSNLTSATQTLDILLLDANGDTLVSHAADVTLGPRATVAVDLLEQLRRDLPKKAKPYAGIFTVEVRGDAGFTESAVLVHVTQFFGTRKKPKAAFVLRPVFRAL
ncbi:MAG: hypothetical protein K8T90_19155 [Planctomycetes bacterium]|nr:hypothetical protein [Planctomycetota bacterium]